MTDKTTTSARLGELEWHLSEYDDKQKSRVLSCSAGDVVASLLFEPEDYDPYLSLTEEDDKFILKTGRAPVQSRSTDGEDGGVLTVRLAANRHENVCETHVADVATVLRQDSDKVVIDGIQDNWLIVLAERLIEVMMCTDTSVWQTTTVDFNIGDEITENMKESALGLVHKIEPGHVGATAALLGNMVYRLPACKSIDELLETVRPVGLDSLRMKGTLSSPVNEEKFFYNTSNIVTSSLISYKKTEAFQRAAFNLKSTGNVHFCTGERPLRRLPAWELRLFQATAASRFTEDPGVISSLMRAGNLIHYYDDEMKFESLLMSVFDEFSSGVVEDVGSVVRTGNYLRSSEILMCSVSEVLVRYATGGTGAFSSKKDHDRALSKESYSSVARNNRNTAKVMTRIIISDQGSSLYNVEDMMLGVVDNISSVCSWIDSVVERNMNDDSHDSVMSPAVVTISAGEALNRCIRSMKDWSFDEADDAYEFTMNLILCLMHYLNELVLLSCEDMEARFYDPRNYEKMNQGRVQTVKTAIDLLKALESADNRTC